MRYGGHAFGFTGSGGRDSQFLNFYDHRGDILDWIKEYSPLALIPSLAPERWLPEALNRYNRELGSGQKT